MMTPAITPAPRTAAAREPVSRRLHLLPPLLTSAGIALGGALLAGLLPDSVLLPFQHTLYRLDGIKEGAAVAVSLRVILIHTAWLGWVCSILALLPFAFPISDPAVAGFRYMGTLALRVLLNFVAAMVMSILLGWPTKSVVLCLTLWYVILLFGGELMFIARFVLDFDQRPPVAKETGSDFSI